MAISTSEAASALRDIEQTDRRTRVTGAYRHASPHLIMWGSIWVAGYVGCGLLPPERWGLVWLPLIIVGVAGAVWLRRGVPANSQSAGSPWRSTAMALAVALFMASVYFVFRPSTPIAYLVFPALLTALVYTLLGALYLARFAWIGAGIFLVTMAGYVLAQPWLAFWIAAAGGGGLILGGLWLRKV